MISDPTESFRLRSGRCVLHCICNVILVVLVLFTVPRSALGRPINSHVGMAAKTAAPVSPVYETRLHYVGNVWFALSNFGTIGTEGTNRIAFKDRWALGINYSPSFEFPAGTRNDFLYGGGLWIGGIVGTDTLVSAAMTAQSVHLDEWNAYDTTWESSANEGSIYYDPAAHADQQYFVRIADTLILTSIDELDGRPHQPLHIEVSQTSYAMPDPSYRQFVIVENWIKNIGPQPINNLAAGVFADADIYNIGQAVPSPYLDDVAGFLDTARNLLNPEFQDPINVAWAVDNDGDPIAGMFPNLSPSSVMGIRILRAPPVSRSSFNWWMVRTSPYGFNGWGPTKAGSRQLNPDDDHGPPLGDRNMYYVMSNGEIDYDQYYSAVDFTDSGWRPPLRNGDCDIADGMDTRFLLSVGPACDPLMPGDSVPFVYAMCGGERFHTNPNALFDCYNPDAYTQTLDYSSLAFAAVQAARLYDAPGIDTDGDGYRGEYHLTDCDSAGVNCDTLYYTGDLGPQPGSAAPCTRFGGAPDWQHYKAPPCADLSVETRYQEVTIRWSGRNTETVRDVASNVIDFEGYRLYVASNNVLEQYSLLAQWDIEDFQQFIYDSASGTWVAQQEPRTLESWRRFYGPEFDPAEYDSPSLGSCFRDTVLDRFGVPQERCSYFQPHAYNRGNEYETDMGTEINIIQRIREDTLIGEWGDTLVYGLYEARVTDLNPGIGLYFSVTAFDFGSAALRVNPLESRVGECLVFAYAVDPDTVPPVVTIGVHQNPLLPEFIDVYVMSNEPVTTSPTVTVNDAVLDVEAVTNELTPVYLGHYELTGSGSVSISATVTDTASNTTDTSLTFISSPVGPPGGLLHSHDRLFRLNFPQDALREEGYLLLFEGENTDGVTYEVRPQALALARPAQIRIVDPSHAEHGDQAAKRLICRQRIDGTWEPLATTVGDGGRTLIATVERLGEFQIRAADAASSAPLPTAALLAQNYPNPFNAATVIEFTLTQPDHVTVEIFNLLGERVATALDEPCDVGHHRIVWTGQGSDGRAAPSGVYFYRLTAGSYSETRKMLLVK